MDPWVSEAFGYEGCLVDENGEEIAVSSSWVLPWRMIPFSQKGPWVGFYAHENGLWMAASSPIMDDAGERFFWGFFVFCHAC
ncbi:MAG: hypothetical protein ACUVQZ_10005 [Candidatus Caldatribacteriaceae bacterium]